MMQKNTVKTAQIRKKLSRRIEMARRSAFRMTPREEEVYLIMDGNSSRVCNLYAGDGTAYSVYITAEPSVLHTEPFFTIYNAAWPVHATHAVRISLWEPKIVRCWENPVQAELELTDELLGMLIDTLHSEHTDVLCPNWVKTMWNRMVSINNREHIETPEWDMRFTHISPQMIREKPAWYRYAVPTRTPMPEYHRLLYPEMTFHEYWRRRHGDKTHAESLHTALKVLEATKQLELLYPEEPNHPRQAYRTNTGTPQFDDRNSAV